MPRNKNPGVKINMVIPQPYFDALNTIQNKSGITCRSVFLRKIFKNVIERNFKNYFDRIDEDEALKGFQTIEKLQIKQFLKKNRKEKERKGKKRK